MTFKYKIIQCMCYFISYQLYMISSLIPAFLVFATIVSFIFLYEVKCAKEDRYSNFRGDMYLVQNFYHIWIWITIAYVVITALNILWILPTVVLSSTYLWKLIFIGLVSVSSGLIIWNLIMYLRYYAYTISALIASLIWLWLTALLS